MDEIRAQAGPITQRYFDKVEADRQALQAKLDAEAATKKAAEEAAKGDAYDIVEIPATHAEAAAEWRDRLIETLAEADDEIGRAA